ncbi:hypothetical protein L2E82_32181 [Cichorium intybus]|uniref:Uncharacterized protein n=1 Tax=Cichorium intybus TaxID=13427 RepID=A0ACB9BG39_CICIN|nr:hypothetical protein L2E82_32181 [Cichorium intybus]
MLNPDLPLIYGILNRDFWWANRNVGMLDAMLEGVPTLQASTLRVTVSAQQQGLSENLSISGRGLTEAVV